MKWFSSLIILLLFLAPQRTEATSYDTMELVGAGDYRYLSFIKLYDARLFAEPGAEDPLSTSSSRCLVLDYNVEIKADQFIEAANTILSRQLSKSQMEKLAPQIGELHRVYKTVEDGDSYSLCFDAKAQATSLSLNGNKLVSIKSPDFSTAYFAIWLGANNPIDMDLRNDLLGGISADSKGGS